MSTNALPNILLIVDRPGWATELNASGLQSALGGRYQVLKKSQTNVTARDLDQADLIQVFYWLQFLQMKTLGDAFSRNLHKLIIGVAGHVGIENERREPGLAWLRRGRAVYVISQLLFQEVKPLLDVPVFYAPSGVDTTLFNPGPQRKRAGALRVGWAGSLSNHGPEIRGFHELIVPAVNAVQGVELVTAIREEYWRTPAEMVEFYRSLDVYLCASRSEGTPNPCLEAAACGIPLVSTRVGNMPELIRPGVNGFFIDREVDSIARVLALLRDSEGLRMRMAKAIRSSIPEWDWRRRTENYHQMYQFVLGGPQAESISGQKAEKHMGAFEEGSISRPSDTSKEADTHAGS
jgi:hypothetical protein